MLTLSTFRRVVPVLAVIAVVAGLVLVFRAGAAGGERAEEPEGLVVRVGEAVPAQQVRRVHRFAGRVEAVRRADLGYEQGGLVAGVLVEEGDRVEAGAVVARLDTARLGARLDEVSAGLAEAGAALELAVRTLERTEAAFAADAVSPQRLDEARQEVALRGATVERLQAQRAALDLDIARAALVAPFAGRVQVRLVDAGAVVAAGQPVVRLLGDVEYDVRVGVRADLAAGLSPGVAVPLDLGDRTVTGVVRTVLPGRMEGSRLVAVLVGLPEQEGKALALGTLVRAVLEEEQAVNGIWLPATALAAGPRGSWTCLVAEPDPSGGEGRFRAAQRPLEQVRVDGERVLVRGDLDPGDAVILDGLHRLVAGQRIRPVREEARP